MAPETKTLGFSRFLANVVGRGGRIFRCLFRDLEESVQPNLRDAAFSSKIDTYGSVANRTYQPGGGKSLN